MSPMSTTLFVICPSNNYIDSVAGLGNDVQRYKLPTVHRNDVLGKRDSESNGVLKLDISSYCQASPI